MTLPVIPPHVHEFITDLDDETGGQIASREFRAWMDIISGRAYFPSNWVFINKEEDFPNQSDTQIFLEEGKLYWQGQTFSTAKSFSVGRNVTLTSGSLGSNPILIYTGTSDMFTGVDVVTFYHRDHSCKASNASQAYNFSDTVAGTTLFQMINVTWRGTATELAVKKAGTFTSLGTIDIINSSFFGSIDGGSSLGVEDGLTVTGVTTILTIAKLAISSLSATYTGIDWSGSTITVFEITNFFQVGIAAGSVGFKCDRNSINITPGTKAIVRDCELVGDISLNALEGGTSRDIRYDYNNNPPIPNSTIIGTLQFDSSVLVTTMTGAATPTHINAEWNDGQVEERLCFQDKLTFDGSTDTCTTANGAVNATGGIAFNHTFTDGDIVRLVENGGLPSGLSEDAEYFVGSLTATTFQLFPDSTLTTPVDFTGNGTEPNYYCHVDGTSKSGWFVLREETTITPIGIDIEGWISAEKTGGGNVDVRSVIMQTDTSFNITRGPNGQRFNAKNNITGGGAVTGVLNLLQGEGFIIYIENVSGATDNIVSDASMVAKV